MDFVDVFDHQFPNQYELLWINSILINRKIPIEKLTLVVENFRNQYYQRLLLLFQRQIRVDYDYSSSDRLRHVVLLFNKKNKNTIEFVKIFLNVFFGHKIYYPDDSLLVVEHYNDVQPDFLVDHDDSLLYVYIYQIEKRHVCCDSQ